MSNICPKCKSTVFNIWRKTEGDCQTCRYHFKTSELLSPVFEGRTETTEEFKAREIEDMVVKKLDEDAEESENKLRETFYD